MPSPESTFFVDTSFHISYKFEKEEHYEEARGIIDDIRSRISKPTFVTTNLVFSETINLILCSERLPRTQRPKLALELGGDIIAFNNILPVSPEMFLEAWKLFQKVRQKGQGWSFVDCSSFVFIREIKKAKYKPDQFTIRNVLAFDSDFDEAQGEFGFKVRRLSK